MNDLKKTVGEDIAKEMIEDRNFCIGIMDCKNRADVKELLASKGINAGDSDIEDLAKNISEIADVCKKLDENDLSYISGGVDKYEVFRKAGLGIGIAAVSLGGLGVLSVVAAWIKKTGDKRNWWSKSEKK